MSDLASPAGTSFAEPVVPTAARPAFVVGIGASAGGLEALEAFFEHVPIDSSMAFVVVQHLSPDFRSLMDEILSRRTKLPVHLVEDGVLVEPNRIYLIPAKKEMIISQGPQRRAPGGFRRAPDQTRGFQRADLTAARARHDTRAGERPAGEVS